MAEGRTSEVAVLKIGSRYDLVLAASQRARELSRGDASLMENRGEHTPIVQSIREIEQGLIGKEYTLKSEKTLYQRPRQSNPRGK
jgi:DNA-directed RNA polymerase subunit omega